MALGRVSRFLSRGKFESSISQHISTLGRRFLVTGNKVSAKQNVRQVAVGKTFNSMRCQMFTRLNSVGFQQSRSLGTRVYQIGMPLLRRPLGTLQIKRWVSSVAKNIAFHFVHVGRDLSQSYTLKNSLSQTGKKIEAVLDALSDIRSALQAVGFDFKVDIEGLAGAEPQQTLLKCKDWCHIVEEHSQMAIDRGFGVRFLIRSINGVSLEARHQDDLINLIRKLGAPFQKDLKSTWVLKVFEAQERIDDDTVAPFLEAVKLATKDMPNPPKFEYAHPYKEVLIDGERKGNIPPSRYVKLSKLIKKLAAKIGLVVDRQTLKCMDGSATADNILEAMENLDAVSKGAHIHDPEQISGQEPGNMTKPVEANVAVAKRYGSDATIDGSAGPHGFSPLRQLLEGFLSPEIAAKIETELQAFEKAEKAWVKDGDAAKYMTPQLAEIQVVSNIAAGAMSDLFNQAKGSIVPLMAEKHSHLSEEERQFQATKLLSELCQTVQTKYLATPEDGHPCAVNGVTPGMKNIQKAVAEVVDSIVKRCSFNFLELCATGAVKIPEEAFEAVDSTMANYFLRHLPGEVPPEIKSVLQKVRLKKCLKDVSVNLGNNNPLTFDKIDDICFSFSKGELDTKKAKNKLVKDLFGRRISAENKKMILDAFELPSGRLNANEVSVIENLQTRKAYDELKSWLGEGMSSYQDFALQASILDIMGASMAEVAKARKIPGPDISLYDNWSEYERDHQNYSVWLQAILSAKGIPSSVVEKRWPFGFSYGGYNALPWRN